MRKIFGKFSKKGFGQRNKLGFTLIEMAIVLTIFGIIIAGAFMMISDAMKTSKVNRLQEQIMNIVENVRSYSSHLDSNKVNLSITDINNLGLLPKDIGNPGTLFVSSVIPAVSYPFYSAYNTGIDVCAAGGTNDLKNVCLDGNFNGLTSTGIAIATFIPPDVCVALASKFSSNYQDIGLSSVGTNGNGLVPGWGHPTDLRSLPDIAHACGNSGTDTRGNLLVRFWFNF